jgi:endogenous inhibitor of DNA gyrase (YacG/DUF329 family)
VKKENIMKYKPFCGERNGDCAACQKDSVSIFVDKIYQMR